MTGISVPARVTTIAPSGGRPPEPAAPASEPAPAPRARGGTALPADGVYVYRVAGRESATLVGGRNNPATLSVTVHRSADTGSDAVLDAPFAPDDTERQVRAVNGDGVVSRSRAAGSPSARPSRRARRTTGRPCSSTPASLEVGTRPSGVSTARDARGGVTSVEDWTVTVVGREPVDIGGRVVDTVVIDLHRETHRGTADQLTRDRRTWLDRTRGVWVRWSERLSGSRALGPLGFGYDTGYTATLTACP